MLVLHRLLNSLKFTPSLTQHFFPFSYYFSSAYVCVIDMPLTSLRLQILALKEASCSSGASTPSVEAFFLLHMPATYFAVFRRTRSARTFLWSPGLWTACVCSRSRPGCFPGWCVLLPSLRLCSGHSAWIPLCHFSLATLAAASALCWPLWGCQGNRGDCLLGQPAQLFMRGCPKQYLLSA